MRSSKPDIDVINQLLLSKRKVSRSYHVSNLRNYGIVFKMPKIDLQSMFTFQNKSFAQTHKLQRSVVIIQKGF